MSYIGQQPVTGDNNSFRILDSISSYTQTFDGSSSAVVSTANSTLTFTGHRFITGQRVTYSTTGTTIGGLSSGSVYYIIKTDQNTLKLASSYVNALASTSITLTSLGVGSTHTLNVAFDSINTKFKATFNNGTKGLITRAAQLNISINGVIQQPQDTTTPTNGFGIEADSTIVFFTAPAVNDAFWGSLVATNFATFDISDNTVDSFTGNASQTNFVLSKTPANNQNVLVTINGVVQYPSDATNIRAYSVTGNVLIFVEAPAGGSLIQVRHIGFAGATSSSVTGFYGRTGNVGLNTSDTVSIGAATIGTGGIGTSLLVQGNARITGILTVGTGSITIDGVNNTITGVINTNATGISTVGSLSIGATSVISAGRQLQNIASLDATTTATIESAVANAPNTFTDLNITGISTLGVTSTTNLTSQQLNVSGISTLGITTATNLTSQQLNVSGISTLGIATASSLVVSGISTLGVTSTTNLTSQQLNVSGISTLGITTASSLVVSGISTLGVTSTTNLTSQSLSVSGISTFTNGPVLVGTATSTGTASQPLQVTGGAYVSGNLGIGTANPTANLQVGVGTAGSAPLKLTAGTNLTTAQAGAIEYDGTTFYATPNQTSGRGILSSQSYYRIGNTAITGNTGTSAQNALGVLANVNSSTVYQFEYFLAFSKPTGTNTHNFAFRFLNGTATVNNILLNRVLYQTTSYNASTFTANVTAYSETFTYTGIAQAPFVIVAFVSGTVGIATGGTIGPQYTLSTSPGGAYSTISGSYFSIWPIGIGTTNLSVGQWT